MQIMLNYVKSSVAAFALLGLGLGLVSPAMAQSASEIAVRMQQLEEQVRQLTGQVEELSFEVKQLRAQGAAPEQSGAVQQLKPAATIAAAPAAEQRQPTQQKRLAAASAGAPIPDSNGIETIEQAPIAAPAAPAGEVVQQDVPGAMPTTKVFGALDNAAAQPDDGGFQGQVLVPPSQQDAGEDSKSCPCKDRQGGGGAHPQGRRARDAGDDNPTAQACFPRPFFPLGFLCFGKTTPARKECQRTR